VRVLTSEDPANHAEPESCAVSRKGHGEALTGEDVGRVLSREKSIQSAVPLWLWAGKTDDDATARRRLTLRGQRPRTHIETPCAETGRSCHRPGNDGTPVRVENPEGVQRR